VTPKPSRRTLLIVDDNPVDREAVTRLLGSDDLVLEAATASHGLALAAVQRPDCILLDHRLPDREGIDLLGEIASSRAAVIMLTGQGDETLAVEAIRRGASDYLVKDRLDREALRRAIAGAIEREALRHELSSRQLALAASEARKTAVMEAALDAIVVMDAAGVIIEFNAAAEQTFGYARSEVIGRPLADCLIPPRLRASHRDGLVRYLQRGDERVLGRRLELSAVRKNGDEFAAEIAIVRIRSDGPPVFTGYIRDITDRLRAAEADALRRSMETIEEANAALETFSDAVAHDLRVPLRALDHFGAALIEDHALDERGVRYVERIRAAAASMGHLIDALFALSNSARGELHVTDVDLSRLARLIVDQLREGDPDRVVEAVIADGLSARGDARLLGALLGNLIANAWKFTGKARQPRIEVGKVTGAAGSGFFVRDNGVGFEMARAAKIFAPFQRLHALDDFPGTGIGLATVARIVRKHGGKVSASARPGEGAVFTVILPDDPLGVLAATARRGGGPAADGCARRS
jgi:PAS domain S-box-containing protein